MTSFETPSQASERLQVSERTLRNLVKSGRLTAYKITDSPNGGVRYRSDDLDNMLIASQ